jgi:hypothetical protein
VIAIVCSEWAVREPSPETLRKIETGRLPTPAFGTITCLSEVLDLPIQDLAAAWRNGLRLEAAS